MSDTKVSEAAVETLGPLRIMQNAHAALIDQADALLAEGVKQFNAALEAAQPAELAEHQGVREQFEAWCTSQTFPMSTRRMPTDSNEYRSLKTREAWRVWQAALAARQPVGVDLRGQVRNLLQHAEAGPDSLAALADMGLITDPDAARLAALLARQPVGQEPVAEWVRAANGNYPELQWRHNHVARIGDLLYAAPPGVTK